MYGRFAYFATLMVEGGLDVNGRCRNFDPQPGNSHDVSSENTSHGRDPQLLNSPLLDQCTDSAMTLGPISLHGARGGLNAGRSHHQPDQ